ncbi:hypothetical protein H5410_055098, partial [Solanum commersonii]
MIGREEVSSVGSIIQGNGEIDDDVTHCIGAWYHKKLRGKFFRAVVKPAMLYEAECWPVKNFVYKMKIVYSGQGSSEVDKMREMRLRWFGHVHKRCMEALVQSCEMLAMDGFKRGRGRSKKYWGE